MAVPTPLAPRSSALPVAVEFSLVAAIMIGRYDLSFVLVTFGTVAVYFAITFAITEWRMDYRHWMNHLDSQSNTQAFDSLINYETVKYFGNERLELKRYDDTLAEWEEMAVASQTSMSVLNFGQGAIIAIGVTLIMTLAAQGVVDGSLSVGDLVLVNALMLQLFIPLGFLGIVYRQIKYALADMDLVFKLLERRPEIQDRPEARPLVLTKGAIRFEQVDFHYQPERPILHGIDFSIEPGQKLAVVGHSGAGKSTLSRLLFRFYEVTGGRILIDGQDIRELTQESLRAAIGIVPQDTVLFNESLYYNLAYGRPDATRAEIERAAGHPQASPPPCLRRGDLVTGQPYRAGDPADPGRGGREPYDPGHRPPALDRGRRRSDSGARTGAHPRAGHPSRAAGSRRSLCRHVGVAAA